MEKKYLIYENFLKGKSKEFISIYDQIDEMIEMMWADYKYAEFSHCELLEIIGLKNENPNCDEHFDMLMKFYLQCYDIRLSDNTGICGVSECGDDFQISKEYGLTYEFHPKK